MTEQDIQKLIEEAGAAITDRACLILDTLKGAGIPYDPETATALVMIGKMARQRLQTEAVQALAEVLGLPLPEERPKEEAAEPVVILPMPPQSM